MTIVILNEDRTIHHIKTDGAGLCPCYCIDRNYNPESVGSPRVYHTEWKEMDKLQQVVLQAAKAEHKVL